MARILKATAGAAVLAALVNVLVYVAALGPIGADLLVDTPVSDGPETLPALNVVALSVGSAVAAGIALGVLNRLTGHARRAFVALALVVLAVSFVPLADPALATPDAWVLGVMHVAAAIPILALLTPLARGGGRGATAG